MTGDHVDVVSPRAATTPDAGAGAGRDENPRDLAFGASQRAQRRLHELVPSGAHTYARASDQYPEGMAPVLVRGRGAHVWDVDGNEFIEYGMGLRAITLGHAYPPVVEAARRAAGDGVSFTRPTTWELAAAERLVAQVPGADMVKFAKNGSDATSAAVRLARAATGRTRVAVCADHPFFSTDDWFIVTSAMDAGIPTSARAETVTFPYNDLPALRAVLAGAPVAAIVLEAATATCEPAPGYLQGVRALADEFGAVLVFDEIITGMRWHAGGAQHVYGVVPDLSTWGKALGNGFSVAALAGRRDLMELAGLAAPGPRVFLLSTTNGPETTGLAAYLAVADTYARRDVVAEMHAAGTRLARGVRQVTEDAGVGQYVHLAGRPTCLVFATRDPSGAPSQTYRALFLQELIRRGVLGQSFVISAAHTNDDVDATIEAVAGAARVYARALDAGHTDGLLWGRPVAPALRRTAAPRALPDAVRPDGQPMEVTPR